LIPLGRTSSSRNSAAIRRITGARANQGPRPQQSFNVSPGANLPVVRYAAADREEKEESTKQGDTEETEKTTGSAEVTESISSEKVLSTNVSTNSKTPRRKQLILTGMKWGLIPSYTKKNADGKAATGYSMINARSETVATSSVYRRLLKHRRCVVPVDGFYEWRKFTDKFGQAKKEPYFVHRPLKGALSDEGCALNPIVVESVESKEDHIQSETETIQTQSIQIQEQTPPTMAQSEARGTATTVREELEEKELNREDLNGMPIMYLAGLWDRWYPEAGGKSGAIESVSILTTQSTQAFGHIHDRLPVILDREGANKWANFLEYSFEECIPYLKPCTDLKWYQVSDTVGSVKNKDHLCVTPIEKFKAQSKAKGIGRFFQPMTSTKVNPRPKPKSTQPGAKRSASVSEGQKPNKKRKP
jgi:putative SOS response-associated peptidase YedK